MTKITLLNYFCFPSPKSILLIRFCCRGPGFRSGEFPKSMPGDCWLCSKTGSLRVANRLNICSIVVWPTEYCAIFRF